MFRVFSILAFLSCVAVAAPSGAGERAHDFQFRSIDGAPLPFSSFAGRPVLVVNTASRCGFTGQYSGLQALWERYREAGLVVLGVPSGDFRQELGSEAEVKEFCEVNFSIDFPMTEIERVKGSDAHPFYRWVGAQAGPPRWNFYKYLIGPDGALIAAYASSDAPDSPAMVGAIEKALEASSARGRWTAPTTAPKTAPAD